MKKIFLALFVFFFLIVSFPALATHQGRIHVNDVCADEKGTRRVDNKNAVIECESGSVCKQQTSERVTDWRCIRSAGSGSNSNVDSVIGKIVPPPPIEAIGYGNVGLSRFLTNVVQLIFIVSGIVFLFMVIIGAFQYIISGGDKAKIEAARSRITWAIVGIILLALSFVIIRVVGQITGFEFFAGQNSILPRSNQTQIEACNRLASQGYSWNGTSCVSTNN